MKLSRIRLNVARWLNPTDKDKAEITRQISNRLRYNRQLLKRSGTVWDDEEQAWKIVKSRRRRLIFWLNQRLISAERRGVEPAARWVYGADLFKIVERLSPTLEALGVIAIPVVLFFATQHYQDNLQQRELEKLQQEAVTNYLNQLSTILLDVDGDLRDPQNERLRTLTTATTLTLLNDPNLNGARKGQVIRFLSRMNLLSVDEIYGPQQPRDRIVTIQLNGAILPGTNLNGVNLRGTTLFGANLSDANLSDANLSGANLDITNLHGADLIFAILSDVRLSNANLLDADLRRAYLQDADLSGANLRGADLFGANLRGADLSDANLRGANLHGAILSRVNLRGADLFGANLRSAYLCNTQLPETIKLNADRDCENMSRWVR